MAGFQPWARLPRTVGASQMDSVGGEGAGSGWCRGLVGGTPVNLLLCLQKSSLRSAHSTAEPDQAEAEQNEGKKSPQQAGPQLVVNGSLIVCVCAHGHGHAGPKVGAENAEWQQPENEVQHAQRADADQQRAAEIFGGTVGVWFHLGLAPWG